jgi:hypothetical protein
MNNLPSFQYDSDWLIVVAGIFGCKCPDGYGIFWKKAYRKEFKE